MSDTTGEHTSMTNELAVTSSSSIQRAERGRFAPGRSGNPRGKLPGTRHHATQVIESLMEGEAEMLGRKALELALSGDTTALKFCLERLSPRMKSRPISIELPSIQTPADIGVALEVVLDAVACGDIETDQAQRMTSMLESRQRNFEAVDLENRLSLVEKKVSRDIRGI